MKHWQFRYTKCENDKPKIVQIDQAASSQYESDCPETTYESSLLQVHTPEIKTISLKIFKTQILAIVRVYSESSVCQQAAIETLQKFGKAYPIESNSNDLDYKNYQATLSSQIHAEKVRLCYEREQSRRIEQDKKEVARNLQQKRAAQRTIIVEEVFENLKPKLIKLQTEEFHEALATLYRIVRFSNTPYCPSCGAVMKIKQGPKSRFWGCVNFPKCHGARNDPTLNLGSPDNLDTR